MVTFVTVAASMEVCRSFEFEVLGTAESHDALQSFLEALPESPERAILAVVRSASDEHDTWRERIRTCTSHPVAHVADSVSLTSGSVYVVLPGAVLRVKDGGPVLNQKEAATEEPPIDSLLQALIEEREAPVRILVSGNGWKERPAIPSSRSLPSPPESNPPSVFEPHGTAYAVEAGEGETADDTIKRRLEKTKTALRERTRQVRQLSRALIHAKESERTRIREILHDDLQQLLFAARMKVQNVRERASLREPHDVLASRAEEFLTDGLRLTRGLSAELMPPDDDRSFVSQFEWLAIRMQETYGLQVAVQSVGEPRLLDRDYRVLLYRLVQELLFNVVKHAGVEEAVLRLTDEGDAVRVDVEDEGKGVSPEDMISQGSVGLDNVVDRIELLGGTVSVESTPGEGTQVTIVFPYPDEQTDVE